jgi:hypothetical protein
MLHQWQSSFMRLKMRGKDPWFMDFYVYRRTPSTDPVLRTLDHRFLPKMRLVTEWSDATVLAATSQHGQKQKRPEQQPWTMQKIMTHLLALICSVLGVECWWLPTEAEDIATLAE